MASISAWGCHSPQGETGLIPSSQRVSAPEISGFPLNFGDSISLAKYRGKVVVLDFWATWCGPCRMELPSLVKLNQSYRDKGVQFIGLSVELNENMSKDYFDKFLASFGITYPVALASTQTIQAYGINPIPATFFIDKSGKIAATFEGLRSETDFTSALDQLVAEPGT